MAAPERRADREARFKTLQSGAPETHAKRIADHIGER